MTNPASDKLVQAYNRMMERIRHALDEAGSKALPGIRHSVDKARGKAVELEELSHDEADKVAYYLKRDVQDAGRHLAETSHELGDWLRFDIDQIEDRLMSVLSLVADRTRLEMLQFEHDIEEGPAWNTHEITGPGTLVCDSCKTPVRFHATGQIPNCPNCGHTVFHRKLLKSDLHQGK